MKISVIIPTRDREAELAETLERIGRLKPSDLGLCELLVIDNDSRHPMDLPDRLGNGVRVRGIRLESNTHAAARNIAATEARGEWLVMLDDDSSLRPCQLIGTLAWLPLDVAAVGGEIWLNQSQRESGGLPEVVVGCGCAFRRDAYLSVGGYDPAFGYYAEEYDLCAKLILGGHRVLQTRSLQFEHRKVTRGRDFNEIMFRLVRNNAWVYQRYAPDVERQAQIDSMLSRYRAIAIREHALEGYERGCDALRESLESQIRSPFGTEQWDRFTGRSAVRAALGDALIRGDASVRLLGPRWGKGREIVESELARLGCGVGGEPDARGVVSSISPGSMLDLCEQHPGAIMPWNFGVCNQDATALHTIA